MIKSSVLKGLGLGLALLSLVACSVDTPPKAKASCRAIDGVDVLLANPMPRVIVLGELHGLESPPDFAKALICHSLTRGNRTALGLEMSDNLDGRLKAFLNSNGEEAAQKDLFNHNMWQSSFTDGRSSEAMLGLLDFARMTQQSRPDFAPFLFQDTDANWSKYETDPNSVSSDIEKGMANHILTHARSGQFDKVIVLVGNLHAKRVRNQFGDHDYDFMAQHMPAPETATLTNVYSAGTAWNCMGNGQGKTVCGASKTKGYIDPDSELAKTGNYAVHLYDQNTETHTDLYGPVPGYDGWFYVGSAQASPPANLDGRKTE